LKPVTDFTKLLTMLTDAALPSLILVICYETVYISCFNSYGKSGNYPTKYVPLQNWYTM